MSEAVTDWHLVPWPPTPEMITAAQDAHMPFGDMELAVQCAILASPDVQGEPVAFCGDAALSLAERTFSTEVDEQLASDITQYARRLHTLYAAPQPSFQLPDFATDPDDSDEVASLWDHGFKRGWNSCLKVVTKAMQSAEQQTAPDVAALVEALTMARETLAYALRTNAPDYFTTDADIAQHVEIQRIDAALAAHRKGGE